MTDYPAPPAHIAPYVEVLGPKGAMDFLLTFGGGEVYLTANPKGRSRLAEAVGIEKAAALAEVLANMKVRVPTAKPWIALCMRTEGKPVAEIARQLHTADVSVRRWLKADGEGATKPVDPRQMRLF